MCYILLKNNLSLSVYLWDLSSVTRDGISAPCSESTGRDNQGIPLSGSFKTLSDLVTMYELRYPSSYKIKSKVHWIILDSRVWPDLVSTTLSAVFLRPSFLLRLLQPHWPTFSYLILGVCYSLSLEFSAIMYSQGHSLHQSLYSNVPLLRCFPSPHYHIYFTHKYTLVPASTWIHTKTVHLAYSTLLHLYVTLLSQLEHEFFEIRDSDLFPAESPAPTTVLGAQTRHPNHVLWMI